MATDSSPAPDDDEFRALVEACLDRFEQEGETALDELCAQHPAHAERLRRRLRTLVRTGLVAREPSGPAFPERLGDFRLLRPLGGGGMGMVFLARQESLGREVAVKVIRPEYAFFAGSKDRFRREVEAVARLEHPSIVPIHVVGEEGGVPFFAMERVRGASLSDVVAALRGRAPRELSGADLERVVVAAAALERRGSETGSGLFAGSWVQVSFRVAREVALALQHAHERGILHRDVKPSNVMLTPQGRVVLLDFGLAHAEGSQDLTRTGAILGSLPYMAPEQVRGEARAVDARTDVYGLGVTLYELLTLRLPYAGETNEATRALVLEGRPPPIGRSNSNVAWDAETVCLTAMERDAAHRYRTAAALAADIQSFLELRPITARRPGPWLRARRAAQRRPARATALVLSLLAAIVAPIAYGLVERARAEDARRNAERLAAALEEGNRQRDRAEEILAESVGTLDRIANRLSRDSVLTPEIDPIRVRLVEEELRFLENLASQEGTSPRVRRATASALTRLVEVRRILGRAGDAEADLGRAIAILEGLLRDEPASPPARFDLALALFELGGCRREATALDDAERHWRRSAVLLQELVGEHGQVIAHREALALVEHNLSTLFFQTNRTERGRRLAERVIAERQALQALRPDSIEDALGISRAHENISQSWVIAGDEGRAEQHLQAARTALLAAHQRDKRAATVRLALARTDRRLAQILARRGEFADAAAKLREVLAELRVLCQELPERHGLYYEAALTTTHLGQILAEATDPAEAENLVAQAIADFEPVAQAHRARQDYRQVLAALFGLAADLASRRLPLDASRASWQRALDLQESLVAENARQPELHDQLAITLDRLAQAELRAGQTEASLATSTRAVAHRKEAAQLAAGAGDYRIGYGMSLCRQAECLVRLGRFEAAIASLEQAVREARVERWTLEMEVFAPLAGRSDYERLLEAADGK